MRLIDADELMNKLQTNEASDFFGSITCAEFMDFISEQPTVYDIDKVVSNIISEAKDTIVDFEIGKFVNTSKAIEIVKQGER